jgi:hypothetical protein
MNSNTPKIVGFDAPLNIAPGAQGVLTMTAPHNFIAKRLVLSVTDTVTLTSADAIIQRLLWNNHELKAGGPIFTSAFPSGFSISGSNGWPIEFDLAVKVADTFQIVLQAPFPNAQIVVGWWITDFGKGSCCA